VISLSDGLELWANGFYGGASDGNQNAELDGNSSTMIAQPVTTIPGATYELRFDFSPRPGRDLADNSVDALVDGAFLMNAQGDGSNLNATDWTTYSDTFVADDVSTDIAFEDKGTDNSFGSLVDNAVLCFVREPDPTYFVDGYKWNDLDGNGVWGEEPTLAGWTIEITDGDTTHSTTTESDGYYWFEVPEGLWTISEVQQEGWVQTAPEGDTCEVNLGGDQAYAIDDVYVPTCNFGNMESIEPTYYVEGYVWNDDNENDCWEGTESCGEGEGEEEVNAEDPLPGWEVRITDGDVTYSTTTDSDGHYYFNVPAGTWTISETVQSEWAQTFPDDGTHEVTVPLELTQAEDTSLFASIMSFIIPTAHAQYAVFFAPQYNFGNNFVGGGSSGGSSGGGGGSTRPHCDAFELNGDVLSWETSKGYDLEITEDGTEVFSTSVNDEVDAGEFDVDANPGSVYELTVHRGSKTDTCELLVPEVLGEQVSAVPAVAPATGAGGAAGTSPLASTIALFGMLLSLGALRVTRNG